MVAAEDDKESADAVRKLKSSGANDKYEVKIYPKGGHGMMEIIQTGAVATLTVADYAPLSRHDINFALRLRDAVRDTADSDSVKAIVLRATGADFSPVPTAAELNAGARVRETQRRAWHAAYCAPSGLYQNLVYCKKIIVTAVEGDCAGAGSMLVLCSDHTVCEGDSRFEAPFIDFPESSLVLAALTMRLNRAKSWMLCAESWSAQRALDAGLVNRVVPRVEVNAVADAAAHAAARTPLDGIAMTKVLLEAFLDTQGVGQDLDMAGFYADSQRVTRVTRVKKSASATGAA